MSAVELPVHKVLLALGDVAAVGAGEEVVLAGDPAVGPKQARLPRPGDVALAIFGADVLALVLNPVEDLVLAGVVPLQGVSAETAPARLVVAITAVAATRRIRLKDNGRSCCLGCGLTATPGDHAPLKLKLA